MRASLLALTLLALPGLAGAATLTKYGQLPSNETWDASNTYSITGDLTIPAGVTLTIAEGTDVTIQSSDSQASGTDTSRVEIVVNGTLIISGAHVHGTASGSSHWYGIEVGSGGEATLTASDIWDGRTLITNAGTTSITGTQLGNTVAGYVNSAGSLTVDSTSMVNGSSTGYGLYMTGGTVIVRNGSLIQNFPGYGIYQYGGSLSVDHTVLNQNGSTSGYYGVYVANAASSTFDHVDIVNGPYYGWLSATNATLTNSIVASNTYYGVYRSAGTLTQNHNDVWSNGTNYYSASADSTSFSANPLFASSSDFHLQSNSPCRKSDSSGAYLGAMDYAGVNTTVLQGFLYQNTTLASSTTMTGDVTVPAGVTLTIPSGVAITTASTDAMASGVDTSRVELVVYGSLVVNGTIAGSASGSSHWYGIEVMSGGNASISGAGIWDGRTLITNAGTTSITATQLGNTVAGYVNSAGNLTVDSTSMVNGSSTGYGLYMTGGTVIVRNGSLIQNFPGYGIYQYGGSLSVDHTVLNQNGSTSGYYGVYVANAASSTFDHVDIVNGPYYGWLSATNATLTNSIVASNTYYGVYRSAGTLTQNHNDVWSNGTNYYSASADSTSISSNPDFVSTSDFHLQAVSPCRGVGSSSSDLGAYAYQTGAVDHVVLTPGSASVTAGGTQTFSATAYDASNQPISGVTFSWTALTAAGSISSSGTLTASCTPGTISAGVIASVGSVSGSANVTITAGSPATLAISPSPASVPAGSTKSFTASAKDACGNTVTPTVTWSAGVNAGTISPAGVYTAPCTAGSYPGAVTATAGSVSAHDDVTVTAAALASLSVSPSSVSLPSGTSQQFSAIGSDGCGNPMSVVPSWTVANGGGSIDGSGLFTAGATVGTFANTVKATASGFAATATVSVTAGSIASISISPGSATLAIGGSQTFTATARDAAGNTVSISPTWSVIHGGGSIDASSGAFTAGTVAGTFTGTVQVSAGGQTATADVVVSPGATTLVLVSPTQTTLAPSGTQLFRANTYDAHGNATSDAVAWSATAAAGTINSSGVFTAGSNPGTYTGAVTASANGASGSADVTISQSALSQLGVQPGSASVSVGGQVAFSAQGVDASGNTVAVSPTWSVVNGGGSIDASTGVFTAGTTPGAFTGTVQASARGLSASATVIVTVGPVVTVSLSPTHPSVSAGGTVQFSASAADAYGNPVTGSVATWSASSAAGSIDASGLFTAGLTAGDYPSAITATVQGIQGTASVQIVGGTTSSSTSGTTTSSGTTTGSSTSGSTTTGSTTGSTTGGSSGTTTSSSTGGSSGSSGSSDGSTSDGTSGSSGGAGQSSGDVKGKGGCGSAQGGLALFALPLVLLALRRRR